MKLTLEQLLAHLKSPLAPIYLIAGDEHLLVQEAADAVRLAAKQAGFNERIQLTTETHFDWTLLQQAGQNLSLFSAQQLIELRLTHQKITEAGKQILLDYSTQPPPEKLLLIITAKLDTEIQNSHWYKTIEKNGVIVQLWPLQLTQIPHWIKQRLQMLGLQADAEGIQLLVTRTEGNLLAAAQEIEKLGLLYPPGQLTVEQIADASADHARYDVFNLIDYILQGQRYSTVRILNSLKEEAVEPTLILWAIAREIRNLTLLAQAIANGQSLAQAFTQYRVWEKRKPWISRTLKCHSLATLQHCLQQAAQVDRLIKGASRGSVWDELASLALRLSGLKLHNSLLPLWEKAPKADEG